MSAGPPLYFTVIDKSVFTSDITNSRLSHIFAKQDQVAWLFPVAKCTDTIVVSNDVLNFCTQHAPHDKEEFASVIGLKVDLIETNPIRMCKIF